MKNEFEGNTEKANEIGRSIEDNESQQEFNKLVTVLEQLETAHEQRIEAGIDKEDHPHLMNERSQQTMVLIEESFGMNQNDKGDQEIEELLNQIQKVESEIIDLLELQNKASKVKKFKERKENLLEGLKTDIEELRGKVDRLKIEVENMISNSEIFDGNKEKREQRIFEQEGLLRQLESQIKDLKLKIKELEGLSIEGFTDVEILDLREILDKINKELEALKKKERKQDQYYAIRKNELLEKEKYIEELRKQIQEETKFVETTIEHKNIHINVVDDIDRMMLEYVKKWNCNVPITRIGNGYYLFGTKKIYAKILNGKLVIRVGGGYMIITEFLDQYSEVELNKIERLMKKEGVDKYEDIKIIISHLGPVWEEKERSLKRRKRSTSSLNKNRKSPKNFGMNK